MAPRERKPALAALAVLLILVGALGATVLVLRAGNRVTAIKVIQPVAAGDVITEKDVTQVMVAQDKSVDYVTWAQRGALSGYRAKTDIVVGTVLVGQMLDSKSNGLQAGQVVIGLSLTAGQFPAGLKIGDTVAAYQVGKTSSGTGSSSGTSGTGGSGGSGGDSPLVAKAKVKSVPGTSSDAIVASGNSQFSVVVDRADAGALAQAAAAGEVALALVPGSGN